MKRMLLTLLLVLASIGVVSTVLAQGSTRVRPYFRRDGTWVPGHYRTRPDGNFYNNWSTRGNINPFTGREGTRITPPRYRDSLWEYRYNRYRF